MADAAVKIRPGASGNSYLVVGVPYQTGVNMYKNIDEPFDPPDQSDYGLTQTQAAWLRCKTTGMISQEQLDDIATVDYVQVHLAAIGATNPKAIFKFRYSGTTVGVPEGGQVWALDTGGVYDQKTRQYGPNWGDATPITKEMLTELNWRWDYEPNGSGGNAGEPYEDPDQY